MTTTSASIEENGTLVVMKKDPHWIFRTYAGYASARESNEVYRRNLSRGQMGLSVAFDLPTQTGYDSAHVMSAGAVGRVGVRISHIEDMRTLCHQIPLADMH